MSATSLVGNVKKTPPVVGTGAQGVSAKAPENFDAAKKELQEFFGKYTTLMNDLIEYAKEIKKPKANMYIIRFRSDWAFAEFNDTMMYLYREFSELRNVIVTVHVNYATITLPEGAKA
jgi:hypothetical protein